MSGDELELRVAWQRHLGTSAVASEWFDTVLGAYRAEGRHYHGVRHVAWVVRHVESIAADHPVDDLDGTVAAAFFHDAVYDPTRDDNEAESAAMAERAVREIGWTEPACRHVADMVMATAGPAPGPVGDSISSPHPTAPTVSASTPARVSRDALRGHSANMGFSSFLTGE